jgi:hypothetical protein
MIAATPRPSSPPITHVVIAAGGAGSATVGAIGTGLVAGAVYLTWAAATYLLEGARGTLLRPEAQVDRLTYALAANVIAGTVLPLWALRVLGDQNGSRRRLACFCTAQCTAISVAAAGLLVLFMLLPLWPLAGAGAAYLNVFAQVVPTSVAEVVVCWVLVGSAVDAAAGRRRAVAGTTKWLVGAALFGLYHFAHSPPYASWTMVIFLTGVGLITGAFFLITGDVYGTVLLHSSLATAGVMGSLAEARSLDHLRSSQPLMYATAGVSVAVLAVLDALWFRGTTRGLQEDWRVNR